ncbi:MAG: hypothetical protein V3T27_06550 [Alphaproteobacteria bacterium]
MPGSTGSVYGAPFAVLHDRLEALTHPLPAADGVAEHCRARAFPALAG